MVDSSSGASQQLLVLKVMRLARPKLSTITPCGFDPADPSGISGLLSDALKIKSGESSVDGVIGEFLIAPQMFENICLGETFTFYVNCVNESDQKVTDVCVKCDLQTNSQRVALSCSIQDVDLVPAEESGQVISHEVKELGQHILICSVNYKTSAGEKMYFRKFFKFPVTKPIDVKTKFYNAEDSSNTDVYLEAQIENTSPGRMVIERVELDPSPCFDVHTIKTMDNTGVCVNVLLPGDVRQFLFCLSPKDSVHSATYKDLTSIGKLDMSWRTAMGERGRLQTSTLQRIAPGYGDVRLVVEKMPSTVAIRQQFDVQLRLYNCSERALDLTLTFSPPPSAPFVYCSLSGLSLGQLPPGSSIPFAIELLPIICGLQNISGLRLYDSNLKRTYEHDDIGQVFAV